MSNHVSVASIIEKNRLGSDVPYLAFIDVGVIDRPVAEIYTNPQHAAIAARYFQDVAAFERGQGAG